MEHNNRNGEDDQATRIYPNQVTQIQNHPNPEAKNNTPSISKPTFATAVQMTINDIFPIEIRHGTQLGKPDVFLNPNDYFGTPAQGCKMTILLKFDREKPYMEDLRKQFISQLYLKGAIKIAFIDSLTVFIDFTYDTDAQQIHFKQYLHFGNYPIKVIRWTPDFKAGVETMIVPIWILVHKLPRHLFKWSILLRSLDSAGVAIAYQATYFKIRGNVAKVKVEIDISRPRLKQIWIRFITPEGGEDGVWLDTG
ncbi:hypothetical protein FXO38_11992 [Capsicum annuum]|nr:hypothetical protein FXO38_11992 [Capsicum annuum]KAF3663267.1 hypothetical protein FXO37_12064 [Capsicum annuum]